MWTVTLRCRNCDSRFTVENVAFEKVYGLTLVVPCPSCGARPYLPEPGDGAPARLHQMMLAEEGARDDIRVEFTLTDQWYKCLALRAARGSDAETCLKNCRRLSGGYLLNCDNKGLAALARLANAARCPEAIAALRQAYLAAIAAA